jgi:hypothetical protein
MPLLKTSSTKKTVNKHRNRRSPNSILEDRRVIDHEKKIEKWGVVGYNNGGGHRFNQIYMQGSLKKKILDYVLEELKKHPDIMVLGPGEGHDTAMLKSVLEQYGVKPVIDALNLYKGTLDKNLIKKKIIRADLSVDKTFEHINFFDDPKLVKKLMANYHLVIAPKSVGVFTNSRAFSLYQVALMLKPKGRAYVEITFDFMKDPEFFKNGVNKTKIVSEFSKQKTIAIRMLSSFLKKQKLDWEYDISVLEESIINSDSAFGFFVEINRIK